ncbi:phosphatidylserine/phosphatidylglycerophosphate/cardiolipin synthase family protein [uncultured Neptuniibacter sp.]|uniref:phospholipase D-like domain-containing protein n=1 Tax=uncultured Neptuniibacter sp. TaxID=502143 RepID=UPI00262A5DEA|nr:phospholipase D-like domain-containing protein [uncultured Neptuniibacter sp.]
MRKQFEWRNGNQLELLVDGERFFPVMLEEMNRANHSLLLEFYFVTSGKILDKFIDAMVAAARRGVMVKMVIDGFGSYRFSKADRSRLEAEGINIVVYNPLHLSKFTRNFARDHRKLLVVDQQVAFIGGTGLSDVYWLSEEQGCPWHELMARIEGPVVTDLVALFNQLWKRCTGLRLPPGGAFEGQEGTRIRVRTVQGFYQQDIKVSFLNRVNSATDKVWLMTAYFLPSFSMRHALRRAAKRGVDVRLIIAGPYTDQPWVFHASKRYYRRLLKSGVRIYEYQPRFLHAKMSVVDEWGSMGSCNLDHWNLRWNLEANIELDDPLCVQQMTEVFHSDLHHCQEVTYEAWSKRPWYRRVKEVVWAWISQLVLKIR